MSSSDIVHLAVLGLVIGGFGGLAVSSRPALPWPFALVLGAGGALGGGYAAWAVFGDGFRNTRMVIAGVAAALFVGAYSIYQRSRRLPR